MSESNQIDISPGTHDLAAMMATRYRWTTPISELIDNSLDAGASKVEIFLQKDCIDVCDDGVGCADLVNMVRRGSSVAQVPGSVRSGQYGIGLKDATVFFCQRTGQIDIMSIHCGKARSISWNPGKTLALGRWLIDAPTEPCVEDVRERLPDGRGTWMRLTLGRKQQDKEGRASLLQTLAFVFYPAICKGKHITVYDGGKPTRLSQAQLPELHDGIEDVIELPGDRRAKIRAGVLPSGKTPLWPGVNLFWRHRSLQQQQSIGCGRYAMMQMSAMVMLEGRGWGVTRHKDGLLDDDVAMLDQALQEKLRPVLEKAQSQALTFEQDKLTDALNVAMAKCVGRGKAKRGPKVNAGTHERKGTARKTKKAQSVGDGGSVWGSIDCPTNGWTIEFIDDPDGDYGRCVDGKRVILNRAVPDIRADIRDGSIKSLYGKAAGLLASYLSVPRQRRIVWPGVPEDASHHETYARIYSDIMRFYDEGTVAQ